MNLVPMYVHVTQGTLWTILLVLAIIAIAIWIFLVLARRR